ncbi:unnamed protein product [Rotaria sp. Silwood2]|nr:unnamed protein product [Rotaria sp. Silwood2]CAF3879748.1 unnamed protein product [Rotaria sp. Silwood2]
MATATNSTQRRIMIITSDERIIDQIRTINNPSSCETLLLECQGNNNSSPLAYNQSTNHKKTKTASFTCAICGSLALGRNFGVITCESCKIFFRRNALKDLAEEKVQNRYKTKENQNFISQTNNETYEQRFELRSSTYPTHLLTSNNTNMIYTDFMEFLPQSLFQLNQAMLSSEDIQRIESVQIAFEKRIELATCDVLTWNPSVYATSLLEYLNSRSVSALRFLTFFKQIPEFNQLHVNDKLILTKYNLLPLFILNCALLFNIDTKQIRETYTDAPWNSSILQIIHGSETCLKVKKLFRSFVHIRLYDYKIIQLVLVVLFLTKGLSTGGGVPEPILNDGMAVYRAQNYYLELLWKYMETIHGFEQAFRIYNKIITRFLTWQKMEKRLRHNMEQNLSRTDENELLPLMKSLLHIS